MLITKFQIQVQKNSEKIAVREKETDITYGDLNYYANSVAHNILEKWDTKQPIEMDRTLNSQQILTRELSSTFQEEVVALLFEHGADMVVGLIGTLKSGKIYLPLDPSYPEKRLIYMLENSGASLIVTNTLNEPLACRLMAKVNHTVKILNISEINPKANYPDIHLGDEGESIAYILYTSGSTGNPKGVVQNRQNIWYFINNYINNFQITADDRLTLFSTIGHDAAVMDIYSALLSGATLYPVNIKDVLNLADLRNWLTEEKISIYHSVPTIFRYFMQTLNGQEEFPDLRYVILGGEEVLENDIVKFQRHFPQGVVLANLYGQSESSYNSMKFFTHDSKGKVTLGETIGETELFLVDEEGAEVDPLEIGQILVASKHVALGYWKDPERTNQVFLDDEEFGCLYVTGDLGRSQLNGEIEYLGRKDFQVKIRGYRVEMSEIENHLLRNSFVKEAVVITKGKLSGEKELVAYLVREDRVGERELRDDLVRSLPDYMIPSHFVFIEAMPLTATNKIDRQALSAMSIEEMVSREFVPPADELEMKLVDFWSEVLGVDQVGVTNSFFELGGHSLKASQLRLKIYKELGVKIPIKEIFSRPTIRQMKELLHLGKQKGLEIEPVDYRDYYPLSSAQTRLFLLDQIEQANTSYNMSGAYWLDGSLDVQRLESAILKLVERHEVLRTSFDLIDGEAVQKIHSQVEFTVQHRKVTPEELSSIVRELIQPFDLKQAPLFRVNLIQVDERYLIFYDMHHIVGDATSTGLLFTELIRLYQMETLSPLKIQYKDFAVWQDQLLKSEEMEKQKHFWLNEFAGEIPILNLPTDYPRPVIMDYQGDQIEFSLDRELTAKLLEMTSKTNTTLFMVLLASFNILLGKYSGQKDLIIGTPIAGRNYPGLENLLGVFINTLALRNQVVGDETFQEYLARVKEKTLTVYENQDYQFEMLVEDLELARNLSRNPLFDVMLILQNVDQVQGQFDQLEVQPYSLTSGMTKFDLTLIGFESEEEISFVLEYRTSLFQRKTVERISKHFTHLLAQLANNLQEKINQVEILTPSELNSIIYQRNRTQRSHTDQLVHQLFEEQAAKTPDQIALVYKDVKLSYRQLNEKANQLAVRLIDLGVKPDQLVGLMVHRSVEMVIGMLAILKSGGAYLPIDPEFPAERISYMLQDSQANILLTEVHLQRKVNFSGEMIDLFDEQSYSMDSSNPALPQRVDSLAYVIYTSGSTGKPKGVMIEHNSVHNLIVGITEQIDFNPEKVMLSLTTISFDIFLLESLLPLTQGAKVVIASEEEQRIPKLFSQVIRKNKVDMIQTTPSRMQLMLSETSGVLGINNLSEILIGGEAFPEELLFSLRKISKAKIYNMYGPTETTVWSTCKDLTTADQITIGYPIANTKVYVLDGNLNAVPDQVIGELFIGGDGVGRGYYNQPALTAERFLPDPFHPGGRMYRTGDLVKWVDEELTFVGRADSQVKIRGYRIEIKEIEVQLVKHESIKRAVVIDRVDSIGNKYLVAYVELGRRGEEVQKAEIEQQVEGEDSLVVSSLREFLARELPEYMIPSYFVRVEEFPLTPNGKVDRDALPEPDGSIKSSRKYLAAEDAIEERLVGIWSEILGIDQPGVNDHFFESGGHSLKAVQLTSAIYKEFQVIFPLREVFFKSTIREMGQFIKNAEQGIYLAIERIEEQDDYPVSSAQKRMFILSELEDHGTGYHIPGVFFYKGQLDLERLEDVFKQLIQRHESLRTSFGVIEGEIRQTVHEQIDFQIDYRDLTQSLDQRKEDLIQEFLQPFDLSQAPLFRVSLVRLKEDQHLLMYDLHHIIADGISLHILTQELKDLYQGKELMPLRIQYKDYVAWQKQLFETGKLEEQKEFWLDRFAGPLPILNLPTDAPRPKVMSFKGDRVTFRLDNEQQVGLKKLADEHGLTLYMTILAIYNILLAKYTGQHDILIGSPIGGRRHADLESLIGVFINTLVMRNKVDLDMRFNQFLALVQENTLQAFENQDYPFDLLIDQLDLERDLSRNPIFNVALTLQNYGENPKRSEGYTSLKLEPYQFARNTVKFDLNLIVAESNEDLEFVFDYSTDLFKKETMFKLVDHFLNLVEGCITQPLARIADLELITLVEKQQLLTEFNQPQVDYVDDLLIQQLFERQVETLPEKTALVADRQRVSYDELNRKSNQLARLLRSKGVGAETIIGVLTKDSIEMIVGILGVLKAGGAYLPMDPKLPQRRIEYMIEDSKAELLLVEKNSLDRVSPEIEVMNLSDETIYVGRDDNLEIVNQLTDLVYVIYTSGSTGRPKGVLIEHKSVLNHIYWYQEYYRVSTNDRLAKYAGFSFDPSVEEIFPYLLSGAEIHLINDEVKLNLIKLNDYFHEHQITINWLPTQICEQFMKLDNRSLRILFTGGDQLKDFVPRDYQLVNNYGPTENTVTTTTYKVTEKVSNIPIGKPITNNQVYILDTNFYLQPVGVYGELWISGVGLARGYLNREDLTADKFVENPFKPGEKMYRTGDLARWLSDGNIEFKGRIDQQVKIRGYRIELGEIESVLLNHPKVEEAVVVLREDVTGASYLCGYLTAYEKEEVDLIELRKYLKEILPEYMVPTYFLVLDQIPLTPNGKVDRKILPVPDSLNHLTKYLPPTNEVEERLATIWSEVLGVEQVGIEDDFFAMGGHSLKATSMISKVYQELNVNLSLREVFSRPTIRELAQGIARLEKGSFTNIEQVEKREYYPVSSAQRRLYILSQMEGISTTYNLPGAFLVTGDLDRNRLRVALEELIKRHETLRTSFKMVDGEVVQKVQTDVVFDLITLDYQVDSSTLVVDELIQEFLQPFDLSRAPLLRITLVQMNDEEYLVMFDLHHIIADGISFAVLAQELSALYHGEHLTPLRIQYKDFAVWQDQLLATGKLKKQEEYWLKCLAGELPILNLPTDHPRPSVMSFNGDQVGFSLTQDQSVRLQKLSAKNDVTLYMTLLAVYNVLLAKYSGQRDILVGSPIAGRRHVDLDQLIGMFVNTLVMRNQFDPEQTFVQFLAQVKDQTLQAFENQDYQFDLLVDKLDLKRDLSRNPIFDAVLTLQNYFQEPADATQNELTFKPYKAQRYTANFDLNIIIVERDEQLDLVVEYRTDLFEKETIDRLTRHFINIVEKITYDPQMKLGEIELITPEEKKELLVNFNNTTVQYPEDLLVQQLFARQVAGTPDKTALVCNGDRLSYAELDKRSNQLAWLLRSKGIQPETIVGILTSDSFEMIIGILGTLKAGGAYLPIDPKLPDQRIGYMLQDSRADLLLTENNSLNKVGDAKIEVINLSEQEIYIGEVDHLEVVNQLKDLAYVIYTSGSTGRPKGVLIEHQSLLNQIHWYKDYYEIGQTDRIVKFAGFSFDPSVVEIFPYLISGAEMHFIDDHIKLNLNKLNEYFHQNQITINFLPTQLCEQFMRYDNKSLRILYTGGDKLNDFVKRDYQLVNNYGPTENTVTATVYQVNERMNNIPIGEPIANNKIYILNQNDQLQPIGVNGELCITGVGLARGYLNRPELTEEKFVANPFKPEERMYRTGDLARWLPNGKIEFMGRIDHQVKIRGYRIELGEIEAELTNNQQVKEAVVLVREDDTGDKYLCGYLIQEENGKINLSELRRDLLESLPEYMIPTYFLILDEIPLTPNGKVDRKALPLPDRSKKEAHHYIAPTNNMEVKLAAIWSEILGLEQISIEDNFFQLGGHSLKATSMITKVYKELNVDLSLKEVFNQPTIRELAKEIAKIEKGSFTNIQKVEEREYYPVSSAQKRLFLIEQLERINTAYNMPQVVILTGEVDILRLENAFNHLIQRHESLRTSFSIVDGEVMQYISSDVAFAIEFLELEHLEIDSGEMKASIKEFIRPFDLNSAPLLRVKLIKANDGYLLVTDVHHIAADGVSMTILMEEFVKLYANEFLAPLEIQYRDFADWQYQLFNSERKKEYEDFWLTMFAGELEALNLPTDYPRPEMADFRGNLYQIELSEELTGQINELALKSEVTLYMVLLAAYNILLAKYSNQSDIVVGSPNAGRHHADLAQVIGMFVNTLPVRNQLQKEQPFSTFLSEVKERMLQVTEYQEYPLEMLIKKLNLQWDLSRNPLFDTVLVLQNMDPLQLNLDNFELRPYPLGLNMTKFDITVTAMEKSNRLTLIFEYRLSLFKEETIRHMAENLIKILETIVEDANMQIKDIQLELDYQRIETMDMGEVDFTF